MSVCVAWCHNCCYQCAANEASKVCTASKTNRKAEEALQKFSKQRHTSVRVQAVSQPVNPAFIVALSQPAGQQCSLCAALAPNTLLQINHSQKHCTNSPPYEKKHISLYHSLVVHVGSKKGHESKVDAYGLQHRHNLRPADIHRVAVDVGVRQKSTQQAKQSTCKARAAATDNTRTPAKSTKRVWKHCVVTC